MNIIELITTLRELKLPPDKIIEAIIQHEEKRLNKKRETGRKKMQRYRLAVRERIKQQLESEPPERKTQW